MVVVGYGKQQKWGGEGGKTLELWWWQWCWWRKMENNSNVVVVDEDTGKQQKCDCGGCGGGFRGEIELDTYSVISCHKGASAYYFDSMNLQMNTLLGVQSTNQKAMQLFP